MAFELAILTFALNWSIDRVPQIPHIVYFSTYSKLRLHMYVYTLSEIIINNLKKNF